MTHEILDDNMLNKLQRLAMIEISESERAKVKQNLSEVLGFVQNLASLDTAGVDLQSERKTPMRDDVVHESPVASDALKHAPKSSENFFVVPKIIE